MHALYLFCVFSEFFLIIHIYKYERDPKMEFIKNYVFILICLNFSHLQNTLHLMQCIYPDVFFHCSKQFSNSSVLMFFNASAIFCFIASTSAKHFPLRTSFIWENKIKQNKQTKVALGRIWWTGRVGHGGHTAFGQKLLNT